MSRDFVGSSEGRSFRQSPHRDRIVRGSPPPLTARYSFIGLAVPERPQQDVYNGFTNPTFVNALFATISPNLSYNQQVSGTSLPTDILAAQLNENYVVGEFLSLTFRITGVFEAYPLTSSSPTLVTSLRGQEFLYIDRPPALTITMSNGSFKAQNDAWSDPRNPNTPASAWQTEFQGNQLVINLGNPGNGSIKTVIATMMVRQPGPFPLSAFVMGATINRIVGGSPPDDPTKWQFTIPFHKRNVENINPPNPLISGKDCIPFGAVDGTGGFPVGYFFGASEGLIIRNQRDCQWCWAKLVAITRTGGHADTVVHG